LNTGRWLSALLTFTLSYLYSLTHLLLAKGLLKSIILISTLHAYRAHFILHTL